MLQSRLLANALAALAVTIITVPARAELTETDNGVTYEFEAVRYVLTPEGLSEVYVDGKQVADGKWTARNATWLFRLGEDAVGFDAVEPADVTVRAENHVRVEHKHREVTVTYDYLFEGEDVLIRARVANHSPDKAVEAVGFGGLRFTWPAPPKGYMPVMHGSQFRAKGVRMMHPGSSATVGGTYAIGEGSGVGTSPANPQLQQTLTLWDYADWTPVDVAKERGQLSRYDLPKRDLKHYVRGTVPPRGALTFSFTLRVSPSTDWEHLLQPYKNWFRETLGPVRYEPVHRPWVMVNSNKSAQYISETNPYGYHDGLNRLDTERGVAQFCDTIAPLVQKIHGQGVIIWGQQGSETRGCEYRPDFDVLPPETRENWPTLQACFDEADLKLGVTTRPGVDAVRQTWEQDRLIRLVANEPSHVQTLVDRFKNMIKLGCTAFYLDSFGMTYEDVLLMQKIREQLGPDIQTYAEWHCDAMLPFTGFYLHIVYSGETNDDPDAFDIMWIGKDNWEIFRWLVDGRVSSAGRVDDTVYDKIRPGLQYEWMLPRKITPLEQLWRFRESAQVLRDVLPKYIDKSGQWIDQTEDSH